MKDETENEAQYEAAMDQFRELDKATRKATIEIYGNYEGTSWYGLIHVGDGDLKTAHFESETGAFNGAIKLLRKFYEDQSRLWEFE